MFIVRKGKVIKEDICGIRNQSWFDSMTDRSEYNEYDYLPIVFGWPEDIVPQNLRDLYSRDRLYFDHYHIKVKYFKDWYVTYRPNIDAGWATSYEKWLIEKKGYVPGYLPTALPEDADIRDMHFIEYERVTDKSNMLYEYLMEHANEVEDNDDIIYCFDN